LINLISVFCVYTKLETVSKIYNLDPSILYIKKFIGNKIP